ncbi:MAG TPA: ADOP family duplicated permease, partial [Vicinamibacterales bacterium]|nr:ADOP family duplicated permease [Vicinamibacterales bacterium]
WKTLRSSGYAHYPFGDAEIEAVRESSRLIDAAAGVTTNGVSGWAFDDGPSAAYVNGALVTGGFFDVLGVKPLLGRSFAASDDKEGSQDVLVISAGLWHRRYGASPDVIGRRVNLGGRPFRIVGVMPPDLDYPRGVEAWRTTQSVPISKMFGDAARREVDMIARLRPGVTIDQATGELAVLTRDFETRATRNVPKGLTPIVRPFQSVIVGDTRPAILALLAAVAFVLLIATANVANLLLMRGEARRAELAIRAALGAGRRRLASQLLMESALLAFLASLVGVAVTWWSLQALTTFVPDGLPRVESVRVDGVVVALVAGVAFITSLLAGVAPAFLSSRLEIVRELLGGGRSVSGPAAKTGRRTLVVAQVALAVTVVAAAGLLTRTLLRLQAVDTGVAADRLVFVSLELPQLKYAGRAAHARFLSDIVESLHGVRGIEAVTPVNASPFAGGWTVPKFSAEGQTEERAAMNPALNLESVHHNYFEALGVSIVRGRPFTEADREGTLDVAIVSEDVADRTWPGVDPIGKRLKMGVPTSTDRWRTVVGIAAATRYRDLTEPRATLYLPAAQFIDAARTLALRTAAPLDLVASTVRERVTLLDPDVQVMRVVPFTSRLDVPLARPRFNAFLLSLFGAAALFLATIGHYAVISSYVRQSEREIALRVALGATPGNVQRLVIGEASWLVGAGVAIGLAVAAAAAQLLRGLAFGIDTLDPVSLTLAALLLIAASAVASYGPLRRATRVDALAMLRT